MVTSSKAAPFTPQLDLKGLSKIPSYFYIEEVKDLLFCVLVYVSYTFSIHQLLYTSYTDTEAAFSAVCWDGRKEKHKGWRNPPFTSLTHQEKTRHQNCMV